MSPNATTDAPLPSRIRSRSIDLSRMNGSSRPPLGRLANTAARAGRAALETVLFLGVGGAMIAGALLFR